MTSEREVPPEEAIAKGISFLNSRKFSSSLVSVGDLLRTFECRLVDTAGVTSTGRGKGVGRQSEASALFEAIEHYYYQTESVAQSAPVLELDLSGRDRRLTVACPDLRLVCAGRPIPLSRLRFVSLDNSEDDLLFPAVLFNPNFESANVEESKAIHTLKLRRYGTNSGTAAGLSAPEAVLHGLLEIIERDAIGIELLRTIIKKEPYPVREIDRDSLPHHMESLLIEVERESCGTVRMFNISTDLNIPTILCQLEARVGGFRRTYFGSGASIVRDHAMERAILEVLQTFHIHHHFGVSLPPEPSSMSEVSLYHRCYFDAGCFGYRGGTLMVALDDIAQPPGNIGNSIPSQQLDFLINLLASRGHKAYARTLSPETVPVMQVVVPSLERFHLVTYGVPVVPGPRGRKTLAVQGTNGAY